MPEEAEFRWGQSIAQPQYRETGAIVWDGVSLDITARKLAEMALQASEEKFQRITESLPGMIYRYVVHPDGQDEMTYVSPQVEQVYELKPEAVLQDMRCLWARMHPDDVPTALAAIEQSANSLEKFWIEHRLLLPKAGLRWVQGIGQPERLENGDVVWDGVAIDISDRKAAEEKLIILSERLELALRGAQIGGLAM